MALFTILQTNKMRSGVWITSTLITQASGESEQAYLGLVQPIVVSPHSNLSPFTYKQATTKSVK